jgi:hypothetical protein
MSDLDKDKKIEEDKSEDTEGNWHRNKVEDEDTEGNWHRNKVEDDDTEGNWHRR